MNGQTLLVIVLAVVAIATTVQAAALVSRRVRAGRAPEDDDGHEAEVAG